MSDIHEQLLAILLQENNFMVWAGSLITSKVISSLKTLFTVHDSESLHGRISVFLLSKHKKNNAKHFPCNLIKFCLLFILSNSLHWIFDGDPKSLHISQHLTTPSASFTVNILGKHCMKNIHEIPSAMFSNLCCIFWQAVSRYWHPPERFSNSYH